MPARVGVPHNMHGLADAVANPACATSVGLLEWAIRDATPVSRPTLSRPSIHFGGLLRRFGDLARTVLPE